MVLLAEGIGLMDSLASAVGQVQVDVFDRSLFRRRSHRHIAGSANKLVVAGLVRTVGFDHIDPGSVVAGADVAVDVADILDLRPRSNPDSSLVVVHRSPADSLDWDLHNLVAVVRTEDSRLGLRVVGSRSCSHESRSVYGWVSPKHYFSELF